MPHRHQAAEYTAKMTYRLILKNAGPFELTLDIILNDRAAFESLRDCGFPKPEVIAKLYSVPIGDILGIIYFAPANAIKITMKRWSTSGAAGESDVYGAQQHAPLLDLEVEC